MIPYWPTFHISASPSGVNNDSHISYLLQQRPHFVARSFFTSHPLLRVGPYTHLHLRSDTIT